jgi:hypothetical protein
VCQHRHQPGARHEVRIVNCGHRDAVAAATLSGDDHRQPVSFSRTQHCIHWGITVDEMDAALETDL